MMRHWLAAACLVVAVGCSPASGPEEPTPSSSSSVPSGSVSLAGTVQEGVEPGCLILRDGGENYLLLGPPVTGLAVGDRVRVRGTPRPELATSCMEGVPFEVVSAESLR